MSYQNILVGEISSLIDSLIDEKITIDPDSVTSEICANHSGELMAEAPFSTHNNHSNVRREVRSVMSKKLDIDHSHGNAQLTIEGFKYVQRYYSIVRDSIYIGVHVDQLTENEINRKSSELSKMGRACLVHSKELIKYYQNKKVNV